jgi:hypothetical protein
MSASQIAANVKAKKGDTILQVTKCGTTSEMLVVSWGKKRATLVRKDLVGTICEDSSRYHMWLENGEIVHKWTIDRLTHYYKNI